eukprot:c11839_g1_i1.p1 GENE.c11839_g1_i1~~c11839_g1_i1.p1  ORF type:complete len:219 (+),score=40.49 c11839_g1_i1:467-1123(+)
MWFLRPPIICFAVHEIPEGKSSAEITGAVRTLVDNFKLRVIVDSSDHSTESRILATDRQEIILVDLMSPQEVAADPIFGPLFQKLKEKNLDKVVWTVVGGSPARLENLNSHIAARSQPLEDVVHDFIMSLIIQAKANISESPNKSIVDLFKLKEHVKIADVDTAVLTSKLVRRQIIGSTTVLVPATQTIGAILKHDLPENPKLEELQEMFATATSPCV